MNRIRTSALAVALAAGTIIPVLASPADAQTHAGTAVGKAWVTGNNLFFTAGKGTSNNVVVSRQSSHLYIVDDVVQINPGKHCKWFDGFDQTKVRCRLFILSRVIINTLDRDDIAVSNVSARSFIEGGDGDDQLTGGFGNDRLSGGTGHDTLHGRAGADYAAGWTGKDEVHGGPGADKLHGEGDDDKLKGGPDNDELFGGSGHHDTLTGNGGNDFADGGTGNSDSCSAEQRVECES